MKRGGKPYKDVGRQVQSGVKPLRQRGRGGGARCHPDLSGHLSSHFLAFDLFSLYNPSSYKTGIFLQEIR